MINKVFFTFILIIAIFNCNFLHSQENKSKYELPENAKENEACLQCHGEKVFDMFSSDSSMTIKKTMHQLIDRDLFYHNQSVHREFKCIDCHSDEYYEFPHPLDVRFEEPYTCMDCHEGDDDYIQFNFEGIAKEFETSIHYERLSDEFSCWECHNPHGYILHARSETSIKEVISYNNNICLSCHSNVDKFKLLTENEATDLIDNHQWLPNQKAHFENIRCIDCHSSLSDTTLVAHQIQTKDKAVKNCIDCHSQNSHLMASLYKFKTQENRNEIGFINAAMLSDTYVIGANRNVYLNKASIFLFILTLGGIILHVIFRIINAK